MNIKKETNVLETTLAIAEKGYAEAYQFLLNEYEQYTENYGPQTLYFLSCLAGGVSRKDDSLKWLKTAIIDHGWWYRPEVLEDEDLEILKDNAEFVSLKSISDIRYANAVSRSKAIFSWEQKTADNLFLAVHGNTQNGKMARADWTPVFDEDRHWQIETVQSAEPDGYGTYRWSYDKRSYLPVAHSMEKAQNKGYQKIACGGFSAGCDMLLRAITFTSARCDLLILQSPWIPFLQDHAEDLLHAIRQKHIALQIFCGQDDEDCLPMSKQLYAMLNQECSNVIFTIQENTRHQFPEKLYTLRELLQTEYRRKNN